MVVGTLRDHGTCSHPHALHLKSFFFVVVQSKMDVASAVTIGGMLYSAGTTIANGISVGASGVVSLASALFSRAEEPPPPMEDTVAKLESVRETVASREARLWEKMENHRERAANFAAGGKVREARMQIRLRQMYDGQIQNTQRTLTAIESHLVAIQSAVLNREVFLALHEGSRALGHRGHDEDAVDEVLESLDEQHDQTRAIMDIIQENPPDASSLDDEAIESELAQLMAPPAAAPEMLVLPPVPTTTLPRHRTI